MSDQGLDINSFLDPDKAELKAQFHRVVEMLNEGTYDPQQIQSLINSIKVLHDLIIPWQVSNPVELDLYVSDYEELGAKFRESQKNGINLEVGKDIAFEIFKRMSQYVIRNGLLRSPPQERGIKWATVPAEKVRK